MCCEQRKTLIRPVGPTSPRGEVKRGRTSPWGRSEEGLGSSDKDTLLVRLCFGRVLACCERRKTLIRPVGPTSPRGRSEEGADFGAARGEVRRDWRRLRVQAPAPSCRSRSRLPGHSRVVRRLESTLPGHSRVVRRLESLLSGHSLKLGASGVVPFAWGLAVGRLVDFWWL